jgi:hypothetical protein
MHTVITMNAKDTLSLLVPVGELPCQHIFCEAGILRWLNNSSHKSVFLVLTDLCQLPPRLAKAPVGRPIYYNHPNAWSATTRAQSCARLGT